MNKTYIAHAGIHLQHTLAGMNSLGSIRSAVLAGFDFVEIDVWLTADGVPVALHDNTLNATYRMRETYEPLPPNTSVSALTYAEICERYVLIADSEEERVCMPTLADCAALTGECGITLMVHPKDARPASVQKMIDVCTEILGENRFYIVSEDAAVRYALSRNPDQKCMQIVVSEDEAAEFCRYPNCILAVRRGETYDAVVDHIHENHHRVETTLNDDIRVDVKADVINYDYRSPGRFERYETVADSIDPACFSTDGIWQEDILHLADGESVSASDSAEIGFGTVEVSFEMLGSAVLQCGSRTFRLSAEKWTACRAPVLLYKESASMRLAAAGSVQVRCLRFRVGRHERQDTQTHISVN